MTTYRILVTGVVQGVGFRPYIHLRAKALCLHGTVRNTASGAELILQGGEEAVRTLLRELKEGRGTPVLAVIDTVTMEELKAEEAPHYDTFTILPSDDSTEVTALLSPDICTCPDCLGELFDPANRRYHYPFLNCTNCGPRFSIIRGIPYDRKNTTMSAFPMCEDCAGEYTDITDRRYHAEPTCCADCGPEMAYVLTARARPYAEGDFAKAPIASCARALIDHRIAAIKGIGGFHLACRADDAQLVNELRERKQRDEKPFAVMCGDVDAARAFAFVDADEEALLNDPARPVVLLRKRDPKAFSHISENSRIGVMLPYAPVHFLLFRALRDIEAKDAPALQGEGGLPIAPPLFGTLIMTSANLSERPIIADNEEALRELSEIADGFLLHNRDIHRRVDDSVVWCVQGAPYFARRSRGFVPLPVFLPDAVKPARQVLALGAEQKATFAFSKGNRVYLSQHIGDLKNIESLSHYETQIRDFEALFALSPEVLATDLHPDYLSTAYGKERAKREGIPLIQVQHHHAHMASCMADNRLAGDVIGITFDGTGFGSDGTAWGGEFLVGGYASFERRGTIRPIAMPGGDLVTKELWRIALVLARDAEVFLAKDEREELIENILSMNINCPETTSIGRLFDGASAMLGIRDEATYEGQGAIMLEAVAAEDVEACYPYDISEENGLYVFDYREMIRVMCRELAKQASGQEGAVAAAKFMNTVTAMAADIASRISRDTGLDRVVLSGGTFQNMYLLRRLPQALSKKGLTPYLHRRVATNDEGLSLGQLAVAGARLKP